MGKVAHGQDRSETIGPILELVGIVEVSVTEPFSPSEKFSTGSGEVEFDNISTNFSTFFLLGNKMEMPVVRDISCYMLTKKTANGAVIAELAELAKFTEEAEIGTTLSEIYSLLVKQANGEEGVLLNDGSANIFYVNCPSGMLRTVSLQWRGGWFVGTPSNTCELVDGTQVFSGEDRLHVPRMMNLQ